jgi:hypothetical protein
MAPAPHLFGLPLAQVFAVYSGLVAIVMAVVLLQRAPRATALIGIAVLAALLAYVGLLAQLGLLTASSHGPPAMALLAGPPSALVLLIALSPAGRALARSLSLPLILALQSLRIGVELTLLALAQARLVPHLLTLAGGNIEILIGLTAPLATWTATRGSMGERIALLWNVVGLASLANVGARAALTMPGAVNLLHAEVPNLAMATVPYSYIPGFMAPLALLLHALAFRAPAAETAHRRARCAVA